MALVKGTNCGFVLIAPVANPAGSPIRVEPTAYGLKDIAPVGATRITEVGWWCDNATEDTNFEVGLYSHDGGTDKPLNRLYVDNTNAKGITAGWKVVAVDWTITPGTTYWIAIQVDNTATTTNIDYNVAAGERRSRDDPATTLSDPWDASFEAEILLAIYAVYTTAPPTGRQVFMNLTSPLWFIVQGIGLFTRLFEKVVTCQKEKAKSGARSALRTLRSADAGFIK